MVHSMAERIIIYWRDIPAQIVVRKGRVAEKRELPERFIKAIDRCAMSVGAKESDAYLAEWRRGSPQACDDDLASVASATFAEICALFDDERLKALVATGGWE